MSYQVLAYISVSFSALTFLRHYTIMTVGKPTDEEILSDVPITQSDQQPVRKLHL